MSNRRRTCRTGRAGSAVVELAVCLPVIVTIVFASIEACSMMFLKQSLYAAAYEGARVAIRPNSSNATVDQRVNEVLDARQVVAPTITREPADVSSVDRGTYITIRVSAACDANSVVAAWFFGGRELTAGCTMVKE